MPANLGLQNSYMVCFTTFNQTPMSAIKSLKRKILLDPVSAWDRLKIATDDLITYRLLEIKVCL